MDDPKVMKAEVSKNGEEFTFEAKFTSRHWEAKVWDASGNLRGTISCGVHGGNLQDLALEEAVYDWVFGCVRDGVGFA